MNVRAKFFVKTLTHHYNSNPGNEAGDVILAPVFANGADKGANAEWAKWTPNGEIKMTITNPPALAAFELGKEFFVDFTPA